jgi:predicted translin family RNA/ssDNA-binding protein
MLTEINSRLKETDGPSEKVIDVSGDIVRKINHAIVLHSDNEEKTFSLLMCLL